MNTGTKKTILFIVMFFVILILYTAYGVNRDNNFAEKMNNYIGDSSQFLVSNDGAYIKGDLLIFDSYPGVPYSHGSDMYPKGLKEVKFDDAETIIAIKCEQGSFLTGGAVEYSDGSFGYQIFCDLTVIDKTLDTITGQRSFIGSEPPETITCRDGVCDSRNGSIPTDEMKAYINNLPQK